MESMDYTLTVRTLVYDTGYRTLARDYSFSFRSLDTTPPTVESSDPAPDSAGFSPQAPLVVRFSEPLDPATVDTRTILLRDPYGNDLPRSVSLAGDTVTVTPLADLLGGKRHTLTIRSKSQGVMDRSGNPLAQDQTVLFETALDATEPAVTATMPASGAAGIAPHAVWRVSFDDSIDPWSVEPTSIRLVDETASTIPITVVWAPSHRTAAVLPGVPLVPGLHYSLILAGGVAGVCNMSNLGLAGNMAVVMEVGADDGIPAVVSTLPGGGEGEVAINVVPRVVFDRPMHAASFDSATVQLTEDGRIIPCTQVLADDLRTLLVNPAQPLATDAVHILTVKGGNFGVLAANHRPLAADRTVTFTTTADPVLPTVTLFPASGTNHVATNTCFVALFSEPIQTETATSDTVRLAYASTGALIEGSLQVTGEGRVVRFRPTGGLPAGKNLRFTIVGGPFGIRDLQGNWLPAETGTDVTVGYQTDTTAPIITLTVNSIPGNMNEGLHLPPFGFTIDVTGYDPSDAAVDPTSIQLDLVGQGSYYPTLAGLFGGIRFPAQDTLAIPVPPSQPCATGPLVIQVSLADLAGNRSIQASLEVTVDNLTATDRPFERNQVVLLDFTTDREGRGAGDGTADFHQDLLDYGLIAAGDPIGKNDRMHQIMVDAIVAKVNELYGRNPDGTPGESPVAIRFVTTRPPAGVPFMHMALGGQDPEGGTRSPGAESTGVLGRAWYDRKNGNFSDNNAGTSPGLGVFPGELFPLPIQTAQGPLPRLPDLLRSPFPAPFAPPGRHARRASPRRPGDPGARFRLWERHGGPAKPLSRRIPGRRRPGRGGGPIAGP